MNASMKAIALAFGLVAMPTLAGQPVNVNTATAEQIAAGLDGIGVAKAALIVEYRNTHGQFKHADELINVKGIGLRTVERNRDFIKLAQATEKDRRSGKKG